METANLGTFSGCGCCLLPSDEEERYGCAERRTVFTHRELRVLKQIREAREKARGLEEYIRHVGSGVSSEDGSVKEAHEELTNLKKLRSKLEEERIAAAEERMRLLGHA